MKQTAKEKQERQRHVLENLHRITSDGARCETRFELDGINVSMSVRSLVGKKLVVFDNLGRPTKAPPRQTQRAPRPDPAVLDQIRQALTGEPMQCSRLDDALRSTR